MKLGMETVSSSMLGPLAVVMFKGTPLSNTTDGWVIRTLSTTTVEIGVPNPGCFAMDFPSINHRHTSAIFMLKALRIWKLPILSETSSCIISVNM